VLSDFNKQPEADRALDAASECSAEPPSQRGHDALEAAIRKTLEQAANDRAAEASRDHPLRVFIEVARQHPGARAISDPQIAADLICALGKHALPAEIFRTSIEQASIDIASTLLADPIASGHLNRAWSVARDAAGWNDL
jgi:hypothetical protein